MISSTRRLYRAHGVRVLADTGRHGHSLVGGSIGTVFEEQESGGALHMAIRPRTNKVKNLVNR